MTNSSASRPAIFGEVLFDSFPDGTSSLGGAPFNVAWNLKGFGLDPLFISRVGDDKNGRKVFDSMNEWGLSTDALQVDKEHQTGMVKVMLDKGEPAFSILPDQAYDFIDDDLMWSTIAEGKYSILYHGSLIARNCVSRSALDLLQSQAHAPVFCDVNLRAPWWEEARVLSMIKNIKWAKLNQEELTKLSGASFKGRESVRKIASQFCKENKIENLVLTLGADGAMIISLSG
ncbi:Fructokinase, partial [hydrothermal vent metagenome]